MATVAGLLFLLVFFLSPRHGLAARALRHRRMARAMEEQLVMLHLKRGEAGTSLDDLASRFAWARKRMEKVLSRLAGRGWVEQNGAGPKLTHSGHDALERTGQTVLMHGAG